MQHCLCCASSDGLIEYKAGWIPEPVLALWRKGVRHAYTGVRTEVRRSSVLLPSHNTAWVVPPPWRFWSAVCSAHTGCSYENSLITVSSILSLILCDLDEINLVTKLTQLSRSSEISEICVTKFSRNRSRRNLILGAEGLCILPVNFLGSVPAISPTNPVKWAS